MGSLVAVSYKIYIFTSLPYEKYQIINSKQNLGSIVPTECNKFTWIKYLFLYWCKTEGYNSWVILIL